MSLPNNHTNKEATIHCHTASSAASPIAAVMRAPFAGYVISVAGVVEAAFTTDMSVAVAIIAAVAGGTAPAAGVAMTGSPFTITASNSAIGTSTSLVPTGANFVNEGDLISFTPSGSTGTNIPATFSATIRRA